MDARQRRLAQWALRAGDDEIDLHSRFSERSGDEDGHAFGTPAGIRGNEQSDVGADRLG
jgi:hypothetical protein